MLALLLVALSQPARPATSAPQASPAAPASAPATPEERAKAIAARLPFAHHAALELRRLAASITDPPLRAAVETQLLTPWLPSEAFAYAHPAEAAKRLRALGLLEGELALPPPRTGNFAAAPGGPCEDGHHGYPGGLAVHTLANALHARALAQVYQHIYGVDLHDDTLIAAALWHDSLKAATLPFRADGSCGPEAKIAGTPAHHVLGLAAGLLRHLPRELLYVIASAHLAPTPANEKTVCSWLEAAGIIASGEKIACPTRAPPEAYLTQLADADYALTGAAWSAYVKSAPPGWERYDALLDGNDLERFGR